MDSNKDRAEAIFKKKADQARDAEAHGRNTRKRVVLFANERRS